MKTHKHVAMARSVVERTEKKHVYREVCWCGALRQRTVVHGESEFSSWARPENDPKPTRAGGVR